MLAARLEPANAPEPAPSQRDDGGAKPHRRRAQTEQSDALGQGTKALGKFLKSRQGKALEKQVARGIFGMLKKSL